MKALVLGLGMLLAGCTIDGAKMIEALGKDPASACVRLTLSTPWGTQTTQVARSNILAGQVRCNDNGLSVEAMQPTYTPLDLTRGGTGITISPMPVPPGVPGARP